MKLVITTENTNATDQAIIAQHAPGAKMRARIELTIVRGLIQALQAAGLKLKADNGEEKPTAGTEDELVKTLFACDEANILTYNPETKEGSAVYLVFGNNGWDVISDFGTSLEGIIDPFMEEVDKLEEQAA